MVERVSDITVEYLLDFCHVDSPDEQDEETLSTALLASKAYVKSYTGLTDAEMDSYPEIVHCVLVLCQDMYDTRAAYVDKSNVNKVVESILNLHVRNFL
jgi:hypothetical protein